MLLHLCQALTGTLVLNVAAWHARRGHAEAAGARCRVQISGRSGSGQVAVDKGKVGFRVSIFPSGEAKVKLPSIRGRSGAVPAGG
jgi:hypothetical protein